MYPTFSAFAGMGTQFANVKFDQDILTPSGTYDTTVLRALINGTRYEVLSPTLVKTGTQVFRVPFRNQIENNFGQNVGISVSIPLFNGGVARTAWQRSKLSLENLQLQKQLDNQTLKQDIYTAYNDAVSALQRFNASTKTIETAEKAFNFSQKRFDVGLQSTIEYLTNQNNLFRARIERLQAQVEYVFRLKVLEFYRGQGIKL